MTPYAPRKKTRAMLARAWELKESVPYAVTLRWIFYQLLQETYYGKKGDYKKFGDKMSKARKRDYGEWRPDSLVDDTREPLIRGDGYKNVTAWLQAMQNSVRCNLDRWYGQNHYVELWFEARGMLRQFEHYTDHITLRPLAGHPSIPFKWSAAKALELADIRYDLPITILYFGDLDDGGEVIAEVTERDVRSWCNTDFEFINCGLTMEQVTRYTIPENPDKPGEYQWVALPDDAAGKIIMGNLERFAGHDLLSARDANERDAEAWLRAELSGLTDRWHER